MILYGFTAGIFSSRKFQRACQENLAFKYLAGMETPAFKTFIEFRRRHREDMKAVFVQTVKLAREPGMAKLGAVALDGFKLEADTSKHKAMSYGRMQEEEKRLKAEIEALLKTAEAALKERERRDNPEEPIDPKKQISFADHDARCYSKKGDGTRYVYNAQAAVDMASQIIVENHIEDSVQDAQAVKPALDNMKQDLDTLPDKLVADAGNGNKNTLKTCRAHMGFRRFFYRGRINVGSEWNLVRAALNVKKMAARMQKSRGWCVLARIVDYIRSLGHLIDATARQDAPLPQHA